MKQIKSRSIGPAACVERLERYKARRHQRAETIEWIRDNDPVRWLKIQEERDWSRVGRSDVKDLGDGAVQYEKHDLAEVETR